METNRHDRQTVRLHSQLIWPMY